MRAMGRRKKKASARFATIDFKESENTFRSLMTEPVRVSQNITSAKVIGPGTQLNSKSDLESASEENVSMALHGVENVEDGATDCLGAGKSSDTRTKNNSRQNNSSLAHQVFDKSSKRVKDPSAHQVFDDGPKSVSAPLGDSDTAEDEANSKPPIETRSDPSFQQQNSRKWATVAQGKPNAPKLVKLRKYDVTDGFTFDEDDPDDLGEVCAHWIRCWEASSE